ncbi:patatin-like phospholipase family protein [Terrisporobacter sp.]
MYADLVCKGGGIKGIALVGALLYFEEYGYTWRKIAGTSVGAIVASLVAVGYSAREIADIMYEVDYSKFADKSTLQSIPVFGPLASLFYSKGTHLGNYIEDFLSKKFEIKGKKYFKDIYEDGESRLKAIASDVTRHKLIILPDDLVEYGINPMEFEIAKAIRMSCSIPFFFKPVILNKKNPSYIVDGGLLSNFPIWIFDVHGKPRWPTFGLNLYDDEKNDNCNVHSFIPYLMDVVETSLVTSEELYFKDCDAVRIVNIPTLGIDTINFDITKDEIISLFNSGYNSAKLFLKTWSFNSYINRFRL